jgi:para-aminobenzoate synthetase/4-amino-4-deoxychorismate lyase
VRAALTSCSVQSRVRLLLAADGRLRTECVPLPEIVPLRRLRVLPGSVDSGDPLLFHKTTARAVYDRAFAQRGDADDALLVNERGELTEATRANIAVKLDGLWLTPALECGLLAGTLRAELLAKGELREARITLEALRQAESVMALNSLRGTSTVTIV